VLQPAYARARAHTHTHKHKHTHAHTHKHTHTHLPYQTISSRPGGKRSERGERKHGMHAGMQTGIRACTQTDLQTSPRDRRSAHTHHANRHHARTTHAHMRAITQTSGSAATMARTANLSSRDISTSKGRRAVSFSSSSSSCSSSFSFSSSSS